MRRRIFEEHLPRSPNERVRTAIVVQILKEIWGQLSPASIRAGWAIAEDEHVLKPDDNADDADSEEEIRPPEIDSLIHWHNPCNKSATKNRLRARLSPRE
jgi:hypothetical protein